MGLTEFFDCVHVIGSYFALTGLPALVAVYVFYRWKFTYWNKQNIRATNPRFPLGDISQAGFLKNVGIVLKEIYDQFDDERYNGMWLFYRPYLMIRDPDLIKIMFIRDFAFFKDRGLYFNEKADPLSGNLFFMGGLKWRNLRSKLSSNFSSGKIKKMIDTMSGKGVKLIRTLDTVVKDGDVVEPKEFAVRYTHEVFASCLLGIHADCMENSNSTFERMGLKVFDPSWFALARTAFTFFVPDLANFFQIRTTPRAVADFFSRLMKDIVRARESEKEIVEYNDFVGCLLKLAKQGYVENVDNRDVNGNSSADDAGSFGKCSFTFDNAVAQAFIFWMGAFESSAITIQFALYEMSMNTKIQEKAREEVERAMVKFDGEITYQSILEMEYLGRVVEETLRKYPPVPLLTRICSKTYKIPDSDVIIEEGVPILISVLGLHMDPKYYPDPEKFDPGRFTEEEKKKRHHYAYLPFGEGLHQCIGQRFALMQIKVGLASLLANYKFELASNTPRNPKFCRKLALYTVRHGIPLKISKLIRQT